MTEITSKGAELLARTLKGTTDDLQEWLLAKHREALLDGIAMGKGSEQKRILALAESLAQHCQPAEANILRDLMTLITDSAAADSNK